MRKGIVFGLDELEKAGKEGLVPVKVSVHKEGKTFLQTFWLRPDQSLPPRAGEVVEAHPDWKGHKETGPSSGPTEEFLNNLREKLAELSLHKPTDEEVAHERQRIQTMDWAALRRRLDKITVPQKMLAFATVLSGSSLKGLAEDARKRLGRMGYDMSGQSTKGEKQVAVDKRTSAEKEEDRELEQEPKVVPATKPKRMIQTEPQPQWKSTSWDDLSSEQKKAASELYAKETGEEEKFANTADWEVDKTTGKVQPSSRKSFEARKKATVEEKAKAAARGETLADIAEADRKMAEKLSAYSSVKTIPAKGQVLKEREEPKPVNIKEELKQAGFEGFKGDLDAYFKTQAELKALKASIEEKSNALEESMSKIRPYLAKLENLEKKENKFRAKFHEDGFEYEFLQFTRSSVPWKDMYIHAFNKLSDEQKGEMRKLETSLQKLTAQEKFERESVSKSLAITKPDILGHLKNLIAAKEKGLRLFQKMMGDARKVHKSMRYVIMVDPLAKAGVRSHYRTSKQGTRFYVGPFQRDVATRHMINIAIKTLKMSDAGALVMGGPTKAEARATLERYGIPRPNEDMETAYAERHTGLFSREPIFDSTGRTKAEVEEDEKHNTGLSKPERYLGPDHADILDDYFAQVKSEQEEPSTDDLIVYMDKLEAEEQFVIPMAIKKRALAQLGRQIPERKFMKYVIMVNDLVKAEIKGHYRTSPKGLRFHVDPYSSSRLAHPKSYVELHDPRLKESEWEHEGMRIRNAGLKDNPTAVLRLRMDRITQPQKMYNFAEALSHAGLNELAGEAFLRLNSMGYGSHGPILHVRKEIFEQDKFQQVKDRGFVRYDDSSFNWNDPQGTPIQMAVRTGELRPAFWQKNENVNDVATGPGILGYATAEALRTGKSKDGLVIARDESKGEDHISAKEFNERWQSLPFFPSSPVAEKPDPVAKPGKINLQDIKHNLNADSVGRKKAGTIIAKWGYFYRHGMEPSKLADKVKRLYPGAEIVDTGDHWHAFVGGAKSGSAQDTYMYVEFRLPEAEKQKIVLPVIDVPELQGPASSELPLYLQRRRRMIITKALRQILEKKGA